MSKNMVLVVGIGVMGLVMAVCMPAGAVPGAGAGPGPGAGPARGVFEQADADGDGMVTFDELSAVRPGITRERFNRLDRNGDGALSKADRAGGNRGDGGRPRGQRIRDIAQQADANADKQLSYEEIVAVKDDFPRQLFDRFDRNGDGVLSKADMPRRPGGRGQMGPGGGRGRMGPGGGRGQMGPGGGHGRVGPGGGRGQMGPGGGKVPPAQNLRRLAVQADADGNKELTYDEIAAVRPGFPEHAFKRLDTNSDGVLSQADRAGRGGRPGGGGPARGLRQMAAQADADGNKKLTYDEITAVRPNMPRELFDRLDRNDDGVLSQADRRQGNKKN